MLPENVVRDLARNGFRITQVRVQDGNGNGWITLEVMEWIGVSHPHEGDPNEPTTGPPIVEGG